MNISSRDGTTNPMMACPKSATEMVALDWQIGLRISFSHHPLCTQHCHCYPSPPLVLPGFKEEENGIAEEIEEKSGRLDTS